METEKLIAQNIESRKANHGKILNREFTGAKEQLEFQINYQNQQSPEIQQKSDDGSFCKKQVNEYKKTPILQVKQCIQAEKVVESELINEQDSTLAQKNKQILNQLKISSEIPQKNYLIQDCLKAVDLRDLSLSTLVQKNQVLKTFEENSQKTNENNEQVQMSCRQTKEDIYRSTTSITQLSKFIPPLALIPSEGLDDEIELLKLKMQASQKFFSIQGWEEIEQRQRRQAQSLLQQVQDIQALERPGQHKDLQHANHLNTLPNPIKNDWNASHKGIQQANRQDLQIINHFVQKKSLENSQVQKSQNTIMVQRIGGNDSLAQRQHIVTHQQITKILHPNIQKQGFYSQITTHSNRSQQLVLSNSDGAQKINQQGEQVATYLEKNINKEIDLLDASQSIFSPPQHPYIKKEKNKKNGPVQYTCLNFQAAQNKIQAISQETTIKDFTMKVQDEEKSFAKASKLQLNKTNEIKSQLVMEQGRQQQEPKQINRVCKQELGDKKKQTKQQEKNTLKDQKGGSLVAKLMILSVSFVFAGALSWASTKSLKISLAVGTISSLLTLGVSNSMHP